MEEKTKQLEAKVSQLGVEVKECENFKLTKEKE